MAEWTPQDDNATALAQRDAWTADAAIRHAEMLRFAALNQAALRTREAAQLRAAKDQILSPAPGDNV
jgi:hypothetical protein